MAQRSQSGHQSALPEFLPAATNNNRGKTQDSSSTTFRPRVSTQGSQPTVQNHQVSTEDSQPTVHSRRVSIQEPLPVIHSRRVSIREPLPVIHSRRVSTQGSQTTVQNHQVSTEDSQPTVHSRRVSIQEPLPVIHSRRLSTQDASSISHQFSAEDVPPITSSHRASVQDTPSVIYSSHFKTRDVPSVFQTHCFSIQSPLSVTRTPWTNVKSVTCSSRVSIPPTTQSPHSSLQVSRSVRARVDVPPSITHSPEASIKSNESIIWTSQESFRDTLDGPQHNPNTPESNLYSSPSGSSTEGRSGRFQDRCRLSHSQLPMGWRLLHEARKISHQLSLVLSLAGMVTIGLISLGQHWIHFQVPLMPPEDPAGYPTILINTIFFVQCPDTSCQNEYDQNAWISMILCILFYLMQAHEYLQEGMTYELGCSFYLAWIGVFLFLMTGFFSYLNYMNFWSLLAIQAIWT
ncbi:uncharacterized protein [Vicugna pacos]|uniref:Uncharacterized protein isoform X2 n=1 Tax=Vicugna pacos TaxID=30538 RepID=A0ABM5DUW4_VICPA